MTCKRHEDRFSLEQNLIAAVDIFTHNRSHLHNFPSHAVFGVTAADRFGGRYHTRGTLSPQRPHRLRPSPHIWRERNIHTKCPHWKQRGEFYTMANRSGADALYIKSTRCVFFQMCRCKEFIAQELLKTLLSAEVTDQDAAASTLRLLRHNIRFLLQNSIREHCLKDKVMVPLKNLRTDRQSTFIRLCIEFFQDWMYKCIISDFWFIMKKQTFLHIIYFVLLSILPENQFQFLFSCHY